MYSFNCLLWYVVFVQIFNFFTTLFLTTFLICHFLALFVPTEGNGCEKWNWQTIHTVAASVFAFCFLTVVGSLLGEHFLIHRRRKAEFKNRVRRVSTLSDRNSTYSRRSSAVSQRGRSVSNVGVNRTRVGSNAPRVSIQR